MITMSNHSGVVSYTVRVRAKSTKLRTNLFGSSNVSRVFEGNFILIIRVDPEGETIAIKALGANEFEVCTLEAGETFAVQLANIRSVWADKPDADTRVHCAIIPDPYPSGP